MAQQMLNLGGNLSPEQQIQQQQIARQQRMAELLMQQGQQTPSGQMVGNRYVAPSFFQYAAPLLQGYVGKKELEKVEGEQLKLAKELREQGKLETQRLMNLIGGRPATSEQVTEMAGPFGEGVGQGNTNIPMPVATMAAQPAIEANPRLALAEALNMQSPQARALLPTILERAMPAPKKPMVVAPGGALVDESGKLIYQAPYKPEAGEGVLGGGVNNNGVPVGRYDKTGRYISPQGRVFTSSAVTEAQKEHDVAMDLGYKLNNLTKNDIKNAYGSAVDYTASKIGQMVGRKDVVNAQNKINSIQIKNVLDNLSQLKGASSDKEMAQMIKDFPAYTASPDVMEKWVERAAKATNRFLKRYENRFGFDTDYTQEGRFGTQEEKPNQTTTGLPKAPASVNPKVWNVMTPEEKALFK
jgi:hypothetical protein